MFSLYHFFIGFVAFWVILSLKNELGNNCCLLAWNFLEVFFLEEAFALIVVRLIGRERRYNKR